jgi:hypothetical protein
MYVKFSAVDLELYHDQRSDSSAMLIFGGSTMHHVSRSTNWSYRMLVRFALMVSILVIQNLSIQAQAQIQTGVSSRQCGEYVEAYKLGGSGYTPYLNFTTDVAQSRDQQEGTKIYSRTLADSAPAANALWLKNWCEKNPLKGYSYASDQLLDALTGKADRAPITADKPHAEPEASKPSVIMPLIMLGGSNNASLPACRVGSTKFCSGCSVTCEAGQVADCHVGSDFFDEKCAFQSRCSCMTPRKKN